MMKKSSQSQSWRYNKRNSPNRTNKRRAKVTNRPIRARSSHKKRTISSFIFSKKIITIMTSLIIAGIIIAFTTVAWISRGLPSPNQLMDREIAQSTTIYDRTGENILYQIHGDEKRTLININEIPEYIKWATISIEDKHFYQHKGFSPLAILRTIITNILYNQRAGGSTLTQQFVKNAILSPEKKYTRKIKELILAYKIENRFSKDEILQMYLNEIPYGSNAYGIEAASQKYFGKSARDITLAEAAILAALPQAPTRYSPYGQNKEILIGRQQYILELMNEQGYINEKEMESAKNYELEFKAPSTNITAPHFVMYIKEILTDKYGEKMVEQGGLKIYTTLDLYKQKIAESVIENRAEDNEKRYGATNASLISIDPKNGQILVMVGSKDYFNEDIDGQVNVSTRLRQPGSSMKPLVYATLFEKGYTPNTILYDVVTNFSTTNKAYEPRNYDGKENGPVTIRKALAGSLNIPAVKAIYLSNINNVIDNAEELGYSSLDDRSRFGLSFVLGGAEVKLLEHVNAFGAFARDGNVQEITGILKVEDKDGNVLEEFEEKIGTQVFKSETVRMINDILSDNNARAYAFGENNYLTLGDRPVAVKTGTTNDYRDAWTIGYTPSIVTGVWVGNNDNSKMNDGAAGGVIAAPIWRDFMRQVLGDTPIEIFKGYKEVKTGKAVLDGDVKTGRIIRIDTASGLLATENTPEEFIKEIISNEHHSILYYVDKNNPLGPTPKNPEKDSQFELWESRILEWAEEEDNIMNSEIPTGIDNLHIPENKPTFSIITPKSNQTLTQLSLVSRVDATAPRGINRVDYYIDSFKVHSSKSFPFSLNYDLSLIKNGYHNLKVVVCDDVSNCSEKSLEFNLISDQNRSTGEGSASIIEPQNGIAVNNIDFPLSIKFSLDNSTYISKIDIYSEKDGENKLLRSIGLLTGNQTTTYIRSLRSGTYNVYANYYNWEGHMKTTDSITVTVN